MMAATSSPPAISNEHVLIDMFLLSECDMFIGKFTSNVDRIPFQLRVANRECVPPYVSLDSPWCCDWAQPAGVGWRDIRYHC